MITPGDADPGPMSAAQPDARSPAGVRWLHASYRIGAVVDLAAAIGMSVPRLYGPTLRATGSFDRSRPEFGYALGTGAPLMWGWTGLLLWADRRPVERRGVLALTLLPVLAGLIANDARGVQRGLFGRRGVVAVRALQVVLAVLFSVSLIKAQQTINIMVETHGKVESDEQTDPNAPRHGTTLFGSFDVRRARVPAMSREVGARRR